MSKQKLTSTKEKPPRRTLVTPEQVQSVLVACNGNVSEAARRLGCSRITIYEHVNNNPSLKLVLAEAREALVDAAETAIDKLIKEGNVAAIIFTLKTQGKRRGWIERQEITGADGDPLKIEIVEVHADTDRSS